MKRQSLNLLQDIVLTELKYMILRKVIKVAYNNRRKVFEPLYKTVIGIEGKTLRELKKIYEDIK